MSNEILVKKLSNVNISEKNLDTWYKRLRFLRDEILGLSQSEFGRLIDSDVTAVSRYERGKGAKEITKNLWRRLRDAFGEEVADWVKSGEIESNFYEEESSETNNGLYAEKIGKRIAQVRKALGFEKQHDIADRIGVSWRTIQNYEQGKFKRVPFAFIETLNKQFNVSKEWLLHGEGEMFEQKPHQVHNSKETKQIVELPFYPDVYASAGGGAYNYAEAAKKISFTKDFLVEFLGLVDFEGLHIITAVGDSMAPTIESGDRLYVLEFAKEENILRDGAIYVISYSSGVVVKRVYVRKDHIVLHSDNPNIADEVLSGDELESATIIGRVVGSTKKF